MKKITLFIMSMFFVLGTSMAQDDATEKSFGLVSVTPDSANFAATVYNIKFQFSKEVEVTLPEGGIEVKNVATQEVIKITRFSASPMDKSNIVLQFEQEVVVDEKEGKEYTQDKYLTTPGKYTYTIPAGCIKSVDGEEFPETTFSFTIATTFSVESYTPTETNELTQIQLTFSHEIEKTAITKNNAYVVDKNWMNYFIKNSTISEDKKTVTLELEDTITTPDNYTLKLHSGAISSKDGTNADAELPIKITTSAMAFSTNFEDGEIVDEIKELIITCGSAKEVKLVEGAPGVEVFLQGGGVAVGKATLENNQITVTFEVEFKEGEYVFAIPAGMFTMDGEANEELLIHVTLFTFPITPLEIVSITPAAGEVNQLERITIKFNQEIALSMNPETWQSFSREIVLKSDDKEYILTYNADKWDVTDELEYMTNAEWVDNQYKITPITAPGNYSLDVSQIIVDHAPEEGTDEYGYPATIWHSKGKTCEGTYTWKITGDAGIEDMTVGEGEVIIYDLLGRRVANLNNLGIYIVNGKKVVIK